MSDMHHLPANRTLALDADGIPWDPNPPCANCRREQPIADSAFCSQDCYWEFWVGLQSQPLAETLGLPNKRGAQAPLGYARIARERPAKAKRALHSANPASYTTGAYQPSLF